MLGEIDRAPVDFYSAPISERYSKDVTRTEYASRPRRESLAKRLGRTARQIHARDGHACRSCNAHRQATPLATWCRSIGLDSRAIRAQARRVLPAVPARRAA